jgi:nitrite reductase/ring-hydroxylating ferredoxin subunit
MSEPRQIDVERVICRLDDLDESAARGFTMGTGDWPLRGFVVRTNNQVRGYINSCPHARHPLNFKPHQFLTADSALILCSSHGALFEKLTGYCVAGPCAGQSLRAVPVEVEGGFVMLADGIDPLALADSAAIG